MNFITPEMVKVMKLTFILLTAAFLQVSAKGLSQNVTLALRNAPMEKVFKEIEKQTGFGFLYTKKMLEDLPAVNINVKNVPLQEVLQYCLKGQMLEYNIRNNTIVIKRKPVVAPPYAPPPLPAVTISGKVTDERSYPIASVSVVIPGTPLGAMTNERGEYSIANAPENAKLLFSYVGYQSQTVDIQGKTVINIVLKLDVQKLDETVIIGYGTTTRRKNTGSVSSITSEEISKQPVANPLNALQGRIAGAIVTQANGLPGSRVTIQIRGQNSLENGQQPLYIIDGVPFNMQDGSSPTFNDLNGRGLYAANRGISPFSLINSADIERIDVLKDADATAIYGTRGANGVVLITTKKATAGKTKVDFNVYHGFGKVARFIDMLNTDQYRQLRKEAYANSGTTPNAINAPDLFVWDSTGTTDWQRKYLGGTANIFDAQAAVSGGDARTRLLFSTGYHNETTVFPGDFGDKRISVRFNADHNSLDKKFNVNVSANYSYDKNDLLVTDLSNAYNLPPNFPVRNADGTLYWDANFDNPEAYLLQKFYTRTNNLAGNAVLRYTILPGLDIKTSIGYNRVSLDQNQQNPAISKNPLTTTPTNSARFATVEQQSYIIEPQATYATKIGDGKLTALLGSTWQSSLAKSTSITADNYSNPNLLATPNGAGLYSSVTASNTLYRYNSVFGRLTYEWQSKYLLNGVIRRDGSSRFGADKRFGTFWSVGAGWIFSSEKWLANALPFLSFGKLRASYGLTGNDQIPDYQYLTLYSATSGVLAYQGSAILTPTRINNPELQWETNKKTEAGIDLGFLRDRLQLTVNYYRNRTDNQLGSLLLSVQSGFNSYQANFDAVIQNTGWEVELNTVNVRTKAFEWKTSFNITVPATKLISASPQYFYFNQASLGQPLSYVLAYRYRGVDPQTGVPLYRDVTKDSLTFTPDYAKDAVVIGYRAPKFYGGLNNSFSYKGFELSFFIQFTKQNGNILPSTIPGRLSSGNTNITWLNRWRKPNDVTAMPKVSTISDFNYGSSDAIWGDASYARLRNATASYTFPKDIANKIKMDNLRVFVQGQNLYTWTKNKYVSDPETIATTNQSPVVMQPLRVFTFGINCTF